MLEPLDEAIEVMERYRKPSRIYLHQIDIDFIVIMDPPGVTIDQSDVVHYRGIPIQPDNQMEISTYVLE
jgi:hypothetical protein